MRKGIPRLYFSDVVSVDFIDIVGAGVLSTLVLELCGEVAALDPSVIFSQEGSDIV